MELILKSWKDPWSLGSQLANHIKSQLCIEKYTCEHEFMNALMWSFIKVALFVTLWLGTEKLLNVTQGGCTSNIHTTLVLCILVMSSQHFN